MEVMVMVTLPCPWCEHQVELPDEPSGSSLRCDECATVVDLAPATEPAVLPIAA